MDIDRVFVYGTLRKNESRAGVFPGQEQLFENCHIEGFDLLHLGGFPGIVPGSGKVIGEVYSIDEDLLARLDRIEGYCGEPGPQNLYNREIVEVIDENGSVGPAYVYVYNLEGSHRDTHEKIESGDWFKK